jgi:DNA invertase Pin-like site-specific DNA recombinase
MDWCEKNGYKDFEIFTDHGISGAKESRPALNRMMEKVENQLCSQVVVFQFSRFARSTSHLLKALEKFKEKKVRFLSICENIDTESPMGVALFTILGCLSQLERELIRERVRAGMKNAKAKGKIIGRVRKRNDMLIHSLLDAGLSFREVAKIAKCSSGSVSASKKEWLAKKALAERLKFEQLSKDLGKNGITDAVEQMKNMNIDGQTVQKIQDKLESDAREKVREIQIVPGYETYD